MEKRAEVLWQEILHQRAVGLVIGKSLALINLVGGKTRQDEVERPEQLQRASEQYTLLALGKA
jgi:hypothetical protein